MNHFFDSEDDAYLTRIEVDLGNLIQLLIGGFIFLIVMGPCACRFGYD